MGKILFGLFMFYITIATIIFVSLFILSDAQARNNVRSIITQLLVALGWPVILFALGTGMVSVRLF